MAGRDDYGGSGRPGSNNSTGGGFSGDRSGGLGGGNASNFGGGGGNIRAPGGMNLNTGGGKGGAGGAATGVPPAIQAALSKKKKPGARPVGGLINAIRQKLGMYDPLSSIRPPSRADWTPSGLPIDTTIPRLGNDPTNGIRGMKPGAIPPNTGSGYNPQWHDLGGNAFRNTTNMNKNREWRGSMDNGVGQSGWGSYGGRK